MKHTWLVRMVGLVMVVVVAFGAVGMAAAQGPDGNPPAQDGEPDGFGRFGGRDGQRSPGERTIGVLMQTVADSTGLDVQDIVAAVRDGQTINDILAENGVDPQTVIDTVTAIVTEQINAAVADGKIDEEQAATALEALDELLVNAMNGELPERETPVQDRAQDVVEHTLVGVLAEMAGVDVQDFVRDALTPPTLAEIAESYGLDVDAIIAETEARITESINTALAEGTITAEQAATALDGLHDRLVER
ncbi:MAG: hypothetical protein K8S97_05075, partial [Anaerolineae bacterium]|nr:hypothetical protein [Anaerolineae bacterium]